jgi:small subunit ribosomal protein S5
MAKFCSASVMVKPARGRGLVAGSSVRSVLELAGITDVSAKILSSSKNKLNIARAGIEALRLVRKTEKKQEKKDIAVPEGEKA